MLQSGRGPIHLKLNQTSENFGFISLNPQDGTFFLFLHELENA